MRESDRFLAIFLLLLYCFKYGLTIECFTCASPAEGQCGFGFNTKDVAPQACRPNENVCLKASSTILGVSVVTRNCGLPEACSLFDECNYCQEDNCNSSDNVKSKHMIASLFTFLLIKFVF